MSTSSSSSSFSSLIHKRLDFGVVEVYEFSVTVGDNPAVLSGCPIATGTMQKHSVVDFDLYEKEFKSTTKKTYDELRFSLHERNALLVEAGFSIPEIAKGRVEATKIREQREATRRKLKRDKQRAEKVQRLVQLLVSRPIRLTQRTTPTTTTTASGTKDKEEKKKMVQAAE
jgi:hypothetical protein